MEKNAMDLSRMCFVIIRNKDKLVYCGMQIDGGDSAYKYAQQNKYSLRIWEMSGKQHLNELDVYERDEIKNYIKGLKKF